MNVKNKCNNLKGNGIIYKIDKCDICDLFISFLLALLSIMLYKCIVKYKKNPMNCYRCCSKADVLFSDASDEVLL